MDKNIRVLIVGLEPHESQEIADQFEGRTSAWGNLPPITVEDGKLLVPRQNGPGLLTVDKVLFHGVFADDMDFFSGLALWGGPCLPSTEAFFASRLKLPCLARALQVSRFAAPKRGFASPGATVYSDTNQVAKWGNWHCGENKTCFTGRFDANEACVIEPFLPGRSVRVAIIGEQSWQVGLEGTDWKKSIHDDRAALEAIDPDLLADTRDLQVSFGLPWIACDYIVGEDGQKHLLEVNAMPNVSRFPEMWEAFCEASLQWLVLE
jgi:hypothetical protein